VLQIQIQGAGGFSTERQVRLQLTHARQAGLLCRTSATQSSRASCVSGRPFGIATACTLRRYRSRSVAELARQALLLSHLSASSRRHPSVSLRNCVTCNNAGTGTMDLRRVRLTASVTVYTESCHSLSPVTLSLNHTDTAADSISHSVHTLSPAGRCRSLCLSLTFISCRSTGRN
jgi:hypothetical protein